MVKIIVILMVWLYAGISEAQVSQGTVFSKTLDGNGSKITSEVVGADRGLHIVCLSGCGGAVGTTDTNIIQLLGVAPSATNPFPQRLSTGVAYYDARDRNWTLSNATDSVAVSGTVALSNLFLLDTTFTGRFSVAYVDADAITDQTTTAMHGQTYLYNGATWDRARGTIANGMLVDVSRIQGNVAVTNAGLTNIDVALSTRLAEATFTGRINTLGQKTMANSTPVVLPSDQAAIPVTVLSTVASANNDGACPSGAANFTVVASNASRTWLAMWASPGNTDDVYIKLGVTATSSDARVAPGQAINFTSGRIYTGQIDAIPVSGTQAVCLMELN